MEYNHIKLSDKEEKELESRIANLMEFAQIHHLPMFLSIVKGNNEKDTEYRNVLYSAQANRITLNKDIIRKYELIAAGFEPVPPRDAMQVDMKDLLIQ